MIAVAGPCVLLYNLEGETGKGYKKLLVTLRLRVRTVEREQYGLPLVLVAAGQGEGAQPWTGEDFDEPMLVFCGLSDAQLDQTLGAMRRAGLPRIPLKAVLTPTNAQWDSLQLYRELSQEHRAMQAQRQGG